MVTPGDSVSLKRPDKRGVAHRAWGVWCWVNVELEFNQDVAPPGAPIVPAARTRLHLASLLIPPCPLQGVHSLQVINGMDRRC